MLDKRHGTSKHYPSMFFTRGNRTEFIKVGSVFRRDSQDKGVETARVLGVSADIHGIPHVVYEITFDRPYRPRFTDGPRTLSLSSFTQLFFERAEA